MSGTQQFGASKYGHDLVTSLLDVGATAFLAINQCQDKGDLASRTLDRINRLKGRSAGGNDILDDNNGVTFGEVSFNELLAAVFFDLLSDRENLRGRFRVIGISGDADAQCDWIGSHGQAADRVHFATQLSRGLANEFPADFSDENGAMRIKRRYSGINIEVTLCPGSQSEASLADRFLEEYLA